MGTENRHGEGKKEKTTFFFHQFFKTKGEGKVSLHSFREKARGWVNESQKPNQTE